MPPRASAGSCLIFHKDESRSNQSPIRSGVKSALAMREGESWNPVCEKCCFWHPIGMERVNLIIDPKEKSKRAAGAIEQQDDQIFWVCQTDRLTGLTGWWPLKRQLQ